MFSTRGLPGRLANLLLACLFVLSVYRAWSLSIAMDEAYTYLSFVAPPLRQILTTYSPNNHVLYSLLAKLSVQTFGLSEFTLRIPSLIGCLLSFAAIVLLSRRLYGSGWMMLLSTCLIALNPLIFDYMSQARGYSLALGFYLLGIFFMKKQPRQRLWLAAAGAALGLSVGANLTFVIPVLALNLYLAIAPRRREVAAWLLLPEILIAAAITAGPLMHAERATFAGGYDSIFDTLRNFAISSVVHDWDGNAAIDFWSWLYPATIGTVLATLATAAFLFVRRASDPWLNLFGGSLWFTAAMLVALHRFAAAPYPFARMVLYCWPLLVFTICLLIGRLRTGPRLLRPLAGLYLLFGVAMVIQSGFQLNVTHFGWQRYSAGTRQIAAFIRERPRPPGREVNIATSGTLYTCLDFYRSMYSSPQWKLQVYAGQKLSAGYLVLDVFDGAKAIPAGFRRVWWEPLSGAAVAIPQ